MNSNSKLQQSATRRVRTVRPMNSVNRAGSGRTSVMIALAALLVGGSAMPYAASVGAATTASKAEKAIPYPLDFCLISAEKFAGSDMTPHEFVYKGQTIKLCCKNCLKDFNKDPKKQMARLAIEVKKLAEARAKQPKS